MSGIKIKTLKIYIPDGVYEKYITDKFEHILFLYNLNGEWI